MPDLHLHHQIVELTSDGILVVGFDGLIEYANRACGELLLVPPSDLVGRSVYDFFDETGKENAAAHLLRAANGDVDTAEVDTLFVSSDGAEVWVRLKPTSLTHAGVALRITENQERKALLDRLAHSQRELQHAEQIAQMGSWTWDLRTEEVHASKGMREIYGALTDLHLSQSSAALRSVTHPEDIERLLNATRELLAGDRERVDVEVRQRGERGWLWVRIRALGSFDDDGNLVTISGTHQDVTRNRDDRDDLQDQITQNSLMQAVSTAANRARTLDEVLRSTQSIVLMHDRWERARAFLPTPERNDIAPHRSRTDEAADAALPHLAARELRTAREAFHAREPVWDPEQELTIAFPVLVDEKVVAVLTITSAPPVRRREMVRTSVEQTAERIAHVVEREQAAREVAEARDRAIEASRHKSEFLATMSHEIRTPLNGITGLTELLSRTVLDAQQRHLVSGIAVSGRSLLAVINDILDFSKIEAGHLGVETIDFEVRDVLDQVAGILGESARAKGLDLQISCHPDVPEIAGGDPGRLCQVITNLGSNAVKFTPRGSVTIRATSEQHDDETLLRVEVRDTGIGIPEEQRAKVFSPFTQADTSTTRRFGGTGLGLAIASELVEAFGGEIGFDSALGRGSTFWFTARLNPPSGTRSDAVLRRTREKLGRSKVLVVDENTANRLVLTEQLSWWHVASTGVDSVPSAFAALEAAIEGGDPFDAVLLDHLVTGPSTHSALQALKEDERFANLPVVMLSSMATGPAEGPCADVAETLTKPIQANALREVLLKVLVGAQEATPPPAPDPSRVGHVLVVEDNPVNQVVARGMLASMGFTVDTADDGHEALAMIAATAYDAVLMDLQMPRVDGYEAVRTIRARERNSARPRLPVLAMTAAAVAGEREKCLSAGMDDFIPKPVAPAALANALDRWVPQGDAAVPDQARDTTDAAGPRSSHLDFERLELLRDLSPDDTAYLDRVIDGFAARSSGVHTRISEAVERRDPAAFAEEAHSIKGSALNIGLPTVARIAKDLEALGRAGTSAGASDLVLRLGAAMSDANEALSAYRDWYRSLPSP